jgi:hypothetical protein
MERDDVLFEKACQKLVRAADQLLCDPQWQILRCYTSIVIKRLQ